MAEQVISLRVNGAEHRILTADHRTLLEVLREDMAMVGTKHGCDLGECGACTVLLDGRPVLACLVLVVQVDGRTITTIEGMAEDGTPHPLQMAFSEKGAAQCGYCTPAMLLTARALLDEVQAPDPDDIRQALAGNLCRCTGYNKIIEAVEAVVGAQD
jgi:carbon-monoxide dehydrogenase small subunit